MKVALVRENIVQRIQEIKTEEEYLEISKSYQCAIDITNANPMPQLGWILDGNHLDLPANASQVDYLINTLIVPSREFGNYIINMFLADMAILGIVPSGKTSLIREATKEVVNRLQFGSFFEAIYEFDAIDLTPEMEPFLNSEMIRKYKNLLLQWVGLPLV